MAAVRRQLSLQTSSIEDELRAFRDRSTAHLAGTTSTGSNSRSNNNTSSSSSSSNSSNIHGINDAVGGSSSILAVEPQVSNVRYDHDSSDHEGETAGSAQPSANTKNVGARVKSIHKVERTFDYNLLIAYSIVAAVAVAIVVAVFAK